MKEHRWGCSGEVINGNYLSANKMQARDSWTCAAVSLPLSLCLPPWEGHTYNTFFRCFG